jgi:outer membrane protein
MKFTPRLLLLPAIAALCGCETVDRAHRAQTDAADRLPGETVATAAQAGLTAGRAFTLAELERIAAGHHPALLKARQAVESARLQIRIAHAGRLPQVSASGAYNRSTQNSWGRPVSSEARGSWSAGVGLDLLLYDFGRLDAAERQALEALVAAEEQLRDTELEIAYGVRTAFFEQHRSVHLLRVAVESERQYAQHLEEARAMVEIGTRRPYDATKAEVDWGNALLEIVTVSNALTVTHAQLNRALGLAENPAYRLDPASLPPPQKGPDDLLADARLNAPALAILHARERAASAYVDQTIAELYPELSLGANADLSGRGFPLAWNLSGALRLVQSLFTGHRRTARIDDAVTQLRTARANLADAEQTLYLNLVSAVADRESARKRADIARLIQKQAEDNLAIVNEQYRVGSSTSIERTDAQVALTQAQANVIRADYDEQTAIARLLRLIGD